LAAEDFFPFLADAVRGDVLREAAGNARERVRMKGPR